MTTPCQGILGFLFGHSFFPRYDEEDSEIYELPEGTIMTSEGEVPSPGYSRKKMYVCDVCIRCGEVVTDPEMEENHEGQPRSDA